MNAVIEPVDLHCEPIQLAAASLGRARLSFLESSQRGSSLGRFSLLAWDPDSVLTLDAGGATLRSAQGVERLDGHPLDVLQGVLDRHRPEGTLSRNVPLAGGAVGWLSYDLNRHIEHVPDRIASSDPLPLGEFGLYNWSLVFDHARQVWSLGVRSAGDARAEWNRRAKELMDIAATHAIDAESIPEAPAVDIEADFSPDEYRDAVRAALRHIVDGDIYQVNLAVKFHAPWAGTPFDLYRRVRAFTPSRYGAFLAGDDYAIVSASPELFLRRSEGRVQTRPIKGTRRRTGDTDRDAELLADLLASAKERAELSMIVDLERNDLGRVCEFGSVTVSDHAYVDELPTVFHTVSTVEGVLRPEVDTAALLRATYPGGSITGVPKVRAMSIIEDLEPVRRGPYTGAIGALGFDGDLSLSIAIRTIVLWNGVASFHAGAGIVADSDPDREYEEVLEKARALARAVGGSL